MNKIQNVIEILTKKKDEIRQATRADVYQIGVPKPYDEGMIRAYECAINLLVEALKESK